VTNLLVQLIDFSSFPDLQTQFTRLRLFHFCLPSRVVRTVPRNLLYSPAVRRRAGR